MILDRLEAGELFIAEQIGIPTLYIDLYEFTGGPTDDDHCWHEFSGFSDICSSVLDGPTWGKAQGLVAEFQKVSEWDQSLSPHFAI